MIKANWELAPHDAETYEIFRGTASHFCKRGYFWVDNEWNPKGEEWNWTILEHHPRIIAWEDMKEGMVVRCVDVKEGGDWYGFGKECRVGTDGDGYFGPLEEDGIFSAAPNLYTFELVSEPEPDALIAEREEEVWTHYLSLSGKCKILIDTPDCSGRIIVIDEDGEYLRVNPVEVKPIKPTSTKAEAWDMASEHAVSVAYIKEHNNIID